MHRSSLCTFITTPEWKSGCLGRLSRAKLGTRTSLIVAIMAQTPIGKTPSTVPQCVDCAPMQASRRTFKKQHFWLQHAPTWPHIYRSVLYCTIRHLLKTSQRVKSLQIEESAEREQNMYLQLDNMRVPEEFQVLNFSFDLANHIQAAYFLSV